jgi:hypothetical protein
MTINKSNSLVILDWDNTLFPSTWVTKNNINLNDIEIRNRYLDFFSELDDQIYKLLQQISEYSKVIIITNALPIWVKISSSVLPKTQYLLRRIKVISARKNFQKITTDAYEWKKLAFQEEVEKELNLSNTQNIISIGDAAYEYKALLNLYDKKRLLKSMKFLEEPTHRILQDQIEVLNDNILQIIKHPKHLDLIFKNVD